MTFVLVLALVAAPDSVAGHLNTLKTSTDAQELQWAVYHLARSGDSAAVPAIRGFLADTGRYLEPDADSLPSPQGTAAFYLGELGDTAAVPVLESWLRIEGHEKTRVEAAAALVRLGRPTHALPVLEYHALLDPTPPKNKVQAVNAFFRSSGEPVLFGTVVDTLHTVSRYMHNILNAGEPYMRARALEWLYTTGVNSDKGIALEEATLIMESRDEGARATAFKVVMMLGTDEAEERIDKATYDWQPDIRFMASRYLAEQKQDKEPDGQ